MGKLHTLKKLWDENRWGIVGVFYDKFVPFEATKGLSDETYLKMIYRLRMGKKLNLDNPMTYTEKLQWLKLYNRKDQYTTMVDKCEAKKYVAERIGGEYIIPTLGVYESFEEIDFEALPDQFVLKCTHDCGGLVICKDKATLDIEEARNKINRCLKNNYFWLGREWPYKNVKPRIIAEAYMEDTSTQELRDYKFFTFDGVCKVVFIASDRQKENEETKFDFYDMDFNHLDINNGHPNADVMPSKPENFEKMQALAEELAQGTPHLRVDFYEVNGKIYFGELTFFHWGGIVPFKPEKWDRILGDWITLPEISQNG